MSVDAERMRNAAVALRQDAEDPFSLAVADWLEAITRDVAIPSVAEWYAAQRVALAVTGGES